MAELWITTRTYRQPCRCPQRGSYGPQDHSPTCTKWERPEWVITLGLKLPANDRLWQLWRGDG